MHKLETKQQKIEYIMNNLEHLKGLEFIYPDEVKACNYAKRILRDYMKKISKSI